jgi:hypothetical protein
MAAQTYAQGWLAVPTIACLTTCRQPWTRTTYAMATRNA